jgi:hypothetical protein
VKCRIDRLQAGQQQDRDKRRGLPHVRHANRHPGRKWADEPVERRADESLEHESDDERRDNRRDGPRQKRDDPKALRAEISRLTQELQKKTPAKTERATEVKVHVFDEKLYSALLERIRHEHHELKVFIEGEIEDTFSKIWDELQVYQNRVKLMPQAEATKKVAARIPTSEKLIEIDFRDGKPVKAGHR